MAPEVIVPLGEGTLELCWLCAHHHVDHGVPLSECATSERCEHTPAEIYPRRGRIPGQPRSIAELDDPTDADLLAPPPDETRFVEIEGRMVQYKFEVARVVTPPGGKSVLQHAKPAWCRGRGPDRAPRKRRAG